MTAPEKVRVQILRIDLDTAKAMLDTVKLPAPGVVNTNRKWSQDVVDNYTVSMLRGRWKFVHQGFAFIGYWGEPGAEMKDGEQRTRALIQACTVGVTVAGIFYAPQPNFSFEVFVTDGLDQDSWMAMDTGKPRHARDFLTSKGEVNTNVLSSVLNLAYCYDNFPWSRDSWTKARITPDMRQEYLDANPSIRESLYQGAKVGKIMTVASAATGYFLAVRAGLPKEKMDEFMASLETGAGHEWTRTNPILRLREMMLNARYGKNRRYSRGEQLALFIKAVKKWISNTKTSNLSFRQKDSAAGAEDFPRF